VCEWECEYCDGWGVVGAEGSGGRVGIASMSVCARGRFWEIERLDAFPDAAVAIPGGAGMGGGRDDGEGGGADGSEMEDDEVRRVRRGGRTRSGERPRRAATGVYLYGITEKCGRRWRSTRAMPQTWIREQRR
jgi:hypothetical protein